MIIPYVLVGQYGLNLDNGSDDMTRKVRSTDFDDQMLDGQPVWQSGQFWPIHLLVSRKSANQGAQRIQSYRRGHPVSYQGKLKRDGRFWLIIIKNGAISYLPVARRAGQLWGMDSNPVWRSPNVNQHPTLMETSKQNYPATQPATRSFVAAEPLSFRTSANWPALASPTKILAAGEQIVYRKIVSNQQIDYLVTEDGYLPYADNRQKHRFGVLLSPTSQSVRFDEATRCYQLNGVFQFTKREVIAYTAPDLAAPIVTHLDKGTIVKYTGKCRTRHRGWLRINFNQRSVHVPFATLYPHHRHYYGVEITGSKLVTRLTEPWQYTNQAGLVNINPRQSALKAQSRQLATVLGRIRQPETVVIGLMTDTHFDASQSSTTRQTYTDLRNFRQFAVDNQLDAMIMNGDLIDGNQTLSRSILDMGDALNALDTHSQVPLMVSLGNHDDNSGFARYVNGYRTEQVMTTHILQNLCHPIITSESDVHNEFYGHLSLAGTRVHLIVLNAFDIPDEAENGYFKRNFDDQPTGIHWTGILQNIRHSRSRFAQAQVKWLARTLNALGEDQQVLIFSHATIRSDNARQAVTPFWTYDWFVNNQQGDYASLYRTIVDHHRQVIAVMSGHTHVDDWSKQDGINWITTTSDIVDRRKTNLVDAKQLGAWDLLAINPSKREVIRLRFGWHDQSGHRSNWRYRLFGDGTNPQRLSLSALSQQLKRQFKPAPRIGNARYYQNQSQQVRQTWRGFKGYFTY